MSRREVQPNRKRVQMVFLAIGYFCLFALLLNIFARLGWIHVHLPGVIGFAARWKLALGAAICFIVAWYIERLGRRSA